MRRAATGALIVLGVACGASPRRDTTPTTADTVRVCGRVEPRGGVQSCVDPLTDEQASHRSHHYRVASRGDVVLSVERRTGAGEPAEAVTGAFSTHYRYVDGEVSERIARRIDGTIAQRTLFTKGGTHRSLVDAEGKPLLRGTTGHVTNYQLDPRGWDAEERSVSADGSPRPDSTGVFTWRFVHDDAGHVIEEAAFDAALAPMLTTDGWHLRRRSIGDLGCELSERYFGVDGKAIAPSKGVAGHDHTCDRWGNRETTRHLGVDGRPISVADEGWGLRFTRDEHGKITARTVLTEPAPSRR